MWVCSFNHGTTTSYRLEGLSHTTFPRKFTPTWTCIAAIMMHPYAHPQHLKVLNSWYTSNMDVKCSQWGFSASTTTLQHHTGRENLHHMVKTAEDLSIIIGYHYEVTVYSFQLGKELHIVYMNTLKVGYTSKAHCFTSQIVSQMWVTSPVTNKICRILHWRTQRGTSG